MSLILSHLLTRHWNPIIISYVQLSINKLLIYLLIQVG